MVERLRRIPEGQDHEGGPLDTGKPHRGQKTTQGPDRGEGGVSHTGARATRGP